MRVLTRGGAHLLRIETGCAGGGFSAAAENYQAEGHAGLGLTCGLVHDQVPTEPWRGGARSAGEPLDGTWRHRCTRAVVCFASVSMADLMSKQRNGAWIGRARICRLSLLQRVPTYLPTYYSILYFAGSRGTAATSGGRAENTPRWSGGYLKHRYIVPQRYYRCRQRTINETAVLVDMNTFTPDKTFVIGLTCRSQGNDSKIFGSLIIRPVRRQCSNTREAVVNLVRECLASNLERDIHWSVALGSTKKPTSFLMKSNYEQQITDMLCYYPPEYMGRFAGWKPWWSLSRLPYEPGRIGAGTRHRCCARSSGTCQ